jgi:TDG/mug DNA glycosylase family protein
MEPSEGFPPVARADARILVLGSLPGQKSLSASEYYAHPQNSFWRIMLELFGIDGHYDERCALLGESKLALWDVLRSSVRRGSLDSDIQRGSAVANDFEVFLKYHANINTIAFNGKKAEQLFRSMVPKEHYRHVRLVGLPSTSPAYAAMSFAGKLNVWAAGLDLDGISQDARAT